MEMRYNRNMSKDAFTRGSVHIQKELAEKRRPQTKNVPDLTDFMNDMFFGATDTSKKTYNLTGNRDGFVTAGDDFLEQGRRSISSVSGGGGDDGLEPARRSVSSRSTEEWLNEAKRMVAKSPARGDSPSRVTSSPRFSTSQQNVSPSLDRRDPLSRTARRHRSPQGFSGEILSKTVNKHTRNNPEVSLDSTKDETTQPASTVHKWFSNILKPQNGAAPNNIPNQSDPISPKSFENPNVPPLPPRQSVSRRSRFQSNNNVPHQHMIPPRPDPSPSKRTFKCPAPINITSTNSTISFDTQLLSPPKHLVESAHSRSISSSTCSTLDNQVSSAEMVLPNKNENDLNGYLKEQKAQIGKIGSGSINGKAKIVLSGHSNSTSSMVTAISYAWLLENRAENGGEVVVPVMNMKRGEMWKQKQAAWLFHHVGLDATALLFSDEVDLESLVMEKKLSILVVGKDILKINGEVGSGCTIVTDNYCENAYDLLQTTMLKKLLLAGILIDTQNLNASTKLSITRDSAAIQLLLAGSVPNYRDTLFDECAFVYSDNAVTPHAESLVMQDQRDNTLTEGMEENYGKCPNEIPGDNKTALPLGKNNDDEANTKIYKSPNNVKVESPNKISPNSGTPTKTPTKTPTAAKAGDPQKGKNGNFLAKWFGFGHK